MALPVRVGQQQQQQQYDPFDLMALRSLPDVLDRFFGGASATGAFGPYGVDIREDADHVYVEADLPGFKKEDVDVSIEAGTLTIRAEKRQEPSAPGKDKQEGNYLLRERRYERFERIFTLPSNVDEQHVQAKLHEGCLTITLNKTEESEPRRIPLS